MSVQELIDELSKIEDKTMPVIREYDGWYNIIQTLDIKELYTQDNYKNITDYPEYNSIDFDGIILRD